MNIFDYGIKALQEDPKVSAEEVRRATVADNAANRVTHFIADLSELAAKDLRNADTLKALIVTGTKILELGLHTKGRLKAAEGRSDAFLEATAANVKTAFRQAISVMDECDLDLGAWAEAMEIAKPALDDLTRISKAMERPGVKTAVTPAVTEKPKPEPGPRLLEEDGEPAPEAEVPEPTPMPCAAPVPALGYTPQPEGDVVDAEVVEPHPLDNKSDEEQDKLFDFGASHFGVRKCTAAGVVTEFTEMLDQLEEAGVEEGLKRKEMKKARQAWVDRWASWQQVEDLYDTFNRLHFALNVRKPISFEIPTDEEFQAYEDSLASTETDEAGNKREGMELRVSQVQLHPEGRSDSVRPQAAPPVEGSREECGADEFTGDGCPF